MQQSIASEGCPRVQTTRQEMGGPSPGFTLIEILVAMAILSILVALALPTYEYFMRTARRGDAHNSLQRVLIEQEKWRANHATYAATLTELGLGDTSQEGHYTLSLSNTSATGFSAAATAQASGPQAGDTGCSPMMLTLSGGAEVARTPADCWKK